MVAQHWRVVGGEDKGGILVRQGKDLASRKETRRLSCGALVKELSFCEHTGRLHYELLLGAGPKDGWVSVNLFGKVLCSKVNPEHLRVEHRQFNAPPQLLWSTTENLRPEAIIWKRELTVRTLDGSAVFTQQAATSRTSTSELLSRICEKTGIRYDLAQVLHQSCVLEAGRRLGDCIASPPEGPLEMTLLKATLDVGPAVTSRSMSGSVIEVLGAVPAIGDSCHFDRDYTFLSLGDFAKRPRMRYVKTSNDDKMTAATEKMWQLVTRMPVTVGLNFRSERHVTDTGASDWLEQGGWERSAMRSTVTTGVPNGPYSGPVYFKVFEAGTIDLMGSNCEEGVYFVFVELR